MACVSSLVLTALLGACRKNDAENPGSASATSATGNQSGAAAEANPQTASGEIGTDRAAEGSSSKPASTQPAVPAFLPLGDAAVGEWAEYTSLVGWTIRHQVVEAQPGRVVVEVEVSGPEGRIGLPSRRTESRDSDPLADQAQRVDARRQLSRSRVDAAGTSWDALLYEDRWTDEEIAYVRRTWVSPAVPVFGTLRMELYGDGELEARIELTAAGAGSEKR
jgi:hypothetical protein